MSTLPTYAVFAFDARAFARWSNETLRPHRISLGSLVAYTETARYVFIRDREAMRGMNFAGVILLDGFDHPEAVSGWDDVRIAFSFHVREAA